MHDAEEQSTDFEIVARLQDVPVYVQLQRVAEIVAVGKMMNRRKHLLPAVCADLFCAFPIPEDGAPALVLQAKAIDLSRHPQSRMEYGSLGPEDVIL